MNASESIFQSHLWSLLLTTSTDTKQGKNIKKICYLIYSLSHLL